MTSDSDGYMSPEILTQNGGETPNCDGGGSNSRRKLFKPGPLTDQTNALILEEVKTNSAMADFSGRMDSIAIRLKSVEEKQIQLTTASTSSSADSSVERKKRKVPSKVRVSVDLRLFCTHI